MGKFTFVPLALLALLCSPYTLGAQRVESQAIVFGRDIRPILASHCFQCHGPDEASREGDLRLDTEEGARRVLSSSEGVTELLNRVTSPDPELVMPPPSTKRPLSPVQVQLLTEWVAAGGRWGSHWSFEPLKSPQVPRIASSRASVLRNPIDHFVQARLSARDVSPSPAAPRETLIRRVTLDLTGLPPTAEEVDAFLGDRSEDAWEKVVDRLLKSPAYGERMAWSWLDAARYADSNGYQGDMERTMWPWRDWVVDAFNRNLPYDAFTLWQLAGDLLPASTVEQKLATGFCRNHMINGEGGRIAEENRVEYVMDMTETTATVWLGLTMNCCRCHDHKFDPLTQHDYYRLSAFFNQTPIDGSGGNPQTPPVLEVPNQEEQQRVTEFEARLAALQRQLRQREEELTKSQPTDAPVDVSVRDSDSVYASLLMEQEGLQKSLNDLRRGIPKVMVMEDLPQARKTWVLARGIYSKRGDEVTANVPAALPQLPNGETMNRLALARWIVSDDNPLTARVTVNRFWQQFFGVGLVKTTDDFGVQGETPLQQDLLDWLASDFRRHGWDVKRLIRQIVTSHTYCQASSISARDERKEREEFGNAIGLSYEDDPENRFLSRGPRFRLPSWILRDLALAASGLLIHDLGGEPVKGYQPAGVWEEATFGGKKYQQDHGDALYRRSLYSFWRRIIAPTMFFDNASRQTCTVKTFRTNTPLHALLTLNDVTFVESARALAERILLSGIQNDGDRIDDLFRHLLARRATDSEKSILVAAIDRSRGEFQANQEGAKQLLAIGESKRNNQLDAIEHAAWTSLTLAILNLDEALTKE